MTDQQWTGDLVWRVSDQNGVSRLYIFVEIHQSGCNTSVSSSGQKIYVSLFLFLYTATLLKPSLTYFCSEYQIF